MTAAEVFRDAVIVQEPGAVALLSYLLQLFVNRNTRRSLSQVTTAAARQPPSRWVSVLTSQLFNLYRLSLFQAFRLELMRVGRNLVCHCCFERVNVHMSYGVLHWTSSSCVLPLFASVFEFDLEAK